MIDVWKTFFLQRIDEWKLPSAGKWTCVLYNNYHAHHSNITLLWFHDAESFPAVITKIFQEPEVPTREFGNLQRAYERAPSWVPRPLYCGRVSGSWLLWMEGVPGSRPRRISASGLRALADNVASVHRVLVGPRNENAPQRHIRAVVQPLAALAQFGEASSVHEGCARLVATTSEEWVDSLAVIPQHGDLYIDNVLSNGRNWYVIDWETFGAIDLPFYDLFTLLYSVLRRQGETPEAWQPSLVRQLPVLVHRYARALQLPTEGLSLLLPLVFANWFHLQWADGRMEFARRMYGVMRHYFEHSDLWQAAFLGEG
jgi:aminoglycoside phosphotransferase (APT) family kinase protein